MKAIDGINFALTPVHLLAFIISIIEIFVYNEGHWYNYVVLVFNPYAMFGGIRYFLDLVDIRKEPTYGTKI